MLPDLTHLGFAMRPAPPRRPSFHTLHQRILPYSIPAELRTQVDDAFRVVEAKIGPVQPSSIPGTELELARIIQTYWRNEDLRHGPSGLAALKKELSPLYEAMVRVLAVYESVSHESRSILNEAGFYKYNISESVQRIETMLNIPSNRGAPSNFHVDNICVCLVEYWERRKSLQFVKNIEVHNGEFLAPCPRFIQLFVGAVDPSVETRSLVTALKKIPVPRPVVRR